MKCRPEVTATRYVYYWERGLCAKLSKNMEISKPKWLSCKRRSSNLVVIVYGFHEIQLANLNAMSLWA